jgi:hypothetical protein
MPLQKSSNALSQDNLCGHRNARRIMFAAEVFLSSARQVSKAVSEFHHAQCFQFF